MLPVGVTMLIREGGPSTDFLVGRVYSFASEECIRRDCEARCVWCELSMRKIG